MKLITIQEASRLSGLTELMIRHYLIQGVVDWGTAVKIKTKYSYKVFEKPFMEWLKERS